MVIAIDFDGTIVEDAYPAIGEPKLVVFETLKMMNKNHHQLVLWTTREGRALAEAVRFCKDNGVYFYAVNMSYSDERIEDIGSRKIICDVFVSNKNFGGLPGWGEIWQEIQLAEKGGVEQEVNLPKAGIVGKILNIFKKR